MAIFYYYCSRRVIPLILANRNNVIYIYIYIDQNQNIDFGTFRPPISEAEAQQKYNGVVHRRLSIPQPILWEPSPTTG